MVFSIYCHNILIILAHNNCGSDFMKTIKYIIILLLVSLFPINALAYSSYIIPGGESIGIDIKMDGIMVVGFYKINGKFNKGTPELKVGDRITKVGYKEIKTISELVDSIEEEMIDGKVDLTFIRNNQVYKTKLSLAYENNVYKTGLFVKDSISGIGTISYIDPETGIYGALGHEIIEVNTNSIVEVKTGTIFKSIITSIDRSVRGTPGGKNAKFYSNKVTGTIEKNTIKGIYGNYTESVKDKSVLEIAPLSEVKKGKATIYTVLKDDNIGEYEINITKIDETNDIKNIYFEVTDSALIEKTGGIVQGMSGSPIIQNNKIIGAVTHVVVSNPKNGYGIGIIEMLKEGEK